MDTITKAQILGSFLNNKKLDITKQYVFEEIFEVVFNYNPSLFELPGLNESFNYLFNTLVLKGSKRIKNNLDFLQQFILPVKDSFSSRFFMGAIKKENNLLISTDCKALAILKDDIQEDGYYIKGLKVFRPKVAFPDYNRIIDINNIQGDKIPLKDFLNSMEINPEFPQTAKITLNTDIYKFNTKYLKMILNYEKIGDIKGVFVVNGERPITFELSSGVVVLMPILSK